MTSFRTYATKGGNRTDAMKQVASSLELCMQGCQLQIVTFIFVRVTIKLVFSASRLLIILEKQFDKSIALEAFFFPKL
jgi:hypothetical protein